MTEANSYPFQRNPAVKQKREENVEQPYYGRPAKKQAIGRRAGDMDEGGVFPKSWGFSGGAKSKTRKKHRKQQSNRRKHPYKRRRKSNKKRPKNKTQKTNKKRRSIKSKLRIKKRTLKKRRR